jgi:chemotaxis protein methyltransferase CheR
VKDLQKERRVLTDPEADQFLQWCLPRLHLRWRGFRKVRSTVQKRINRRLQELGLPNVEAYRTYIEDHATEWAMLDTLCWIPISHFYRDRSVFQHLEHEVLPGLAQLMVARGEVEMRCWSAGCAGGEEPYTLAILWKHRLAMRFPIIRLQILATDIDPEAIRRAERGCYRASSLRDLPIEWRSEAFSTMTDELCLKEEYRAEVTFIVQDIRESLIEGPFHLILCRNLVFTYFDETSQREILQKLTDKLCSGGALIIGKLESLPDGPSEIQPWLPGLGVYRRTMAVSIDSPHTETPTT